MEDVVKVIHDENITNEEQDLDLQAAVGHVQALEPDQKVYRPFMFYRAFSNMIMAKWLLIRKQIVVEGVLYREVVAHKTVMLDMGKINGSFEEGALLRMLCMLHQYGGHPDYPAIRRIYASGWRNKQSLEFASVFDQDQGDLRRFVNAIIGICENGTRMLIVSRCMLTSLKTMWNLYIKLGLVITNI